MGQNRQRAVESLLNSGARVDNIMVHPYSDWISLALALNIKLSWEVFVDRVAVLDELFLKFIENMIGYGDNDFF